MCRANVQINLETQYVLEDSMVKALTFDLESSSITLELITPIFKGHAEYGGILNKIKRYFSEGVYLDSDARNLILTFSDCKIKSRSIIEKDQDRASPISYWSLKTVENGSGEIEFRADDIEIYFCFQSLSYKERML